MIWTCWNGEKYGKDYDEQHEIALATSQHKVQEIYEQMRNSINDQESALLHAHPLEEILNWMKAHLDAYLVTAKVIFRTECQSRISQLAPCAIACVVMVAGRCMIVH